MSQQYNPLKAVIHATVNYIHPITGKTKTLTVQRGSIQQIEEEVDSFFKEWYNIPIYSIEHRIILH